MEATPPEDLGRHKALVGGSQGNGQPKSSQFSTRRPTTLRCQRLLVFFVYVIRPTFPRSAAWVRRNPVRVLPILAAYMVGMGSVCARLAEIAGFGSGYRNLAGGTQWVKAPTPL